MHLETLSFFGLVALVAAEPATPASSHLLVRRAPMKFTESLSRFSKIGQGSSRSHQAHESQTADDVNQPMVQLQLKNQQSIDDLDEIHQAHQDLYKNTHENFAKAMELNKGAGHKVDMKLMNLRQENHIDALNKLQEQEKVDQKHRHGERMANFYGDWGEKTAKMPDGLRQEVEAFGKRKTTDGKVDGKFYKKLLHLQYQQEKNRADGINRLQEKMGDQLKAFPLTAQKFTGVEADQGHQDTARRAMRDAALDAEKKMHDEHYKQRDDVEKNLRFGEPAIDPMLQMRVNRVQSSELDKPLPPPSERSKIFPGVRRPETATPSSLAIGYDAPSSNFLKIGSSGSGAKTNKPLLQLGGPSSDWRSSDSPKTGYQNKNKKDRY